MPAPFGRVNDDRMAERTLAPKRQLASKSSTSFSLSGRDWQGIRLVDIKTYVAYINYVNLLEY